MATHVADNPDAGRYEVTVDGATAGFAGYRRTGSTLTLTHTEIDPAFEGRGFGSVLVRAVLDAARSDGSAVLPVCPFVRSYIERHDQYVDLVPAAQRARFGLGGEPRG